MCSPSERLMWGGAIGTVRPGDSVLFGHYTITLQKRNVIDKKITIYNIRIIEKNNYNKWSKTNKIINISNNYIQFDNYEIIY